MRSRAFPFLMAFALLCAPSANAISAAYIKANVADSTLKAGLLSLLDLGENDTTAGQAQTRCRLKALLKRYPDNREANWMQGLWEISSGRVLQGIDRLDNLRLLGLDDTEFLNDYVRAVFCAMIPEKTDLRALLKEQPDTLGGALTVSPSTREYHIVKSSRHPSPSFIYGASYAFRRPAPLNFSGLAAPFNRRAPLSYSPPSALLDTLTSMEELTQARFDTAAVKICIDFNDTRGPLEKYLANRVNGVYDSIHVNADESRPNSLSLRCFSRCRVRGEQGETATYLVFDRSLGDLFHKSGRRARHRDDDRKVRFTVMVKSGSDVAELADAKFQSLLRSF